MIRMVFGVQDERRVTLTVGIQAGWCLQSAVRYGVSTKADLKALFQWFHLGYLLLNWSSTATYAAM